MTHDKLSFGGSQTADLAGLSALLTLICLIELSISLSAHLLCRCICQLSTKLYSTFCQFSTKLYHFILRLTWHYLVHLLISSSMANVEIGAKLNEGHLGMNKTSRPTNHCMAGRFNTTQQIEKPG